MADSKKNKQAQKQTLTPEEILARGFRARCRFRAAIRMVIRNIYWLDDIDEQELGDDIKKNVLLLTRKKEKKSLLTLTDKSILNKPLENRTKEEQQHLNRVIGNLKCFKKFQNEVKSKLAGVTFFYYYGPGRTVVRQGDQAHALYFVLTGEVTVSQNMYDPIFEKIVTKPLCTMGPGMMFGEVALLHDLARESTIITRTHCELLCLKKTDFEIVLKKTVQEQWEEIRNALNMFTYFNEWSELLIRECCVLARLRVFSRDQTILGDGTGLRNFVYFILKGQCKIIEHLLVTTAVVNGRKQYQLYVPSPLTEELSADSIISDTNLLLENLKNQTIDKGSINSRDKSAAALITGVGDETKSKSSGGSYSKHSLTDSQKSALRYTKKMSLTVKTTKKKVPISVEDQRRISTVINLSSKLAPPASDTSLPSNVETYFMQVCLLNPTACFGIGENMAHRRVVAVTPTQCLLIPRNWLMQKHVGNIWLRLQQYLNNHIPTTEEVFTEFINRRKWLKFREEVLEDAFAKKKIDTNNALTNVPYSIRINEQIDV